MTQIELQFYRDHAITTCAMPRNYVLKFLRCARKTFKEDYHFEHSTKFTVICKRNRFAWGGPDSNKFYDLGRAI